MLKNNRISKILSVFLTLALIMTIIPLGMIISQAESTTFAGGSGTEEDPYLIANATQLDNIKLNMSAHYKLVNDIEFTDADFEKGGEFYNSGKGWEPIGTSATNFKGVFDGNGHTISNLYINNPLQNYVGLFGYVAYATQPVTIKNITLKNINIIGNDYVGGVAGYLRSTSIENVNVDGTVTGNNYVGGIAGCSYSSSTISGCYIQGDVSGSELVGGILGYQNPDESKNTIDNFVKYCNNAATVSGSTKVGGIVGRSISNVSYSYGNGYYCYGNSYIQYCSNSGSVNSSNSFAGGIVGEMNGDIHKTTSASYFAKCKIVSCYNSAVVKASNYAGGIVGENTHTDVTHCYSAGEISTSSSSASNFGGCFGTDPSSSTFCYYLEDAVVNPTCTSGIAKSEDQMRKQSTYEQWDFDTIWTMSGREDYPYPELQAVPLVLPEDSVHTHEYAEEITTPATHTSTGVVTYTCECGETYTDIIEKTTEHTYSATVTAPTCAEIGYTTYTCECGDTYFDDYVSAIGHDFKSVVTSPTCTEYGYTTFTCDCGEFYICDYVNAIGHKYESEITTPATHLNDGIETFTCDCGDTYTKTIDKNTEHDFKTVVTVPTCTEKGYTTYTCDCGSTYVDDYVNVTGHNYISEITVPATHTKEGVKTFTCVCGDTYSEPIGKTVTHKFESVTVEPTCTEHGYTTHTCECGETYTRNYVNALGHDIVIDEEVSATCTSTGLTEGQHCTRCDDATVEQEIVPVLDHDIIIDESVASTCISTGLTEGQHCSRCDDVTVEQEIVPVKPHNHIETYDSAKHWKECSCGSIIDVQTHSFNADSVCSCGYNRTVSATLSIKNNTGTNTINYGETLKLTAVATNKPYDAKIYWYVDGVLMGEGEIFNVSLESGTKIVTVKLVDANGYVLKDANGNDISDNEKVSVNAGFFQKIISFFKNLFGMNRTIVQAVFRGVF